MPIPAAEQEGADDAPDVEVVEPEAVEVERQSREEPASGPDRPSREERRRERTNAFKEATAKAERLEAEIADRDERLARMERETAEMRGYLAAQAQRERQDPNATPEKRIESLEDEAQMHLERAAAMAAAKNQDGSKREMRAYNAKMREATVLAMQSSLMPQLDQRFQQFQQNQPDPQIAHAITTVAQEFPDLATDAEFQGAADAAYRRLLAAGRPANSLTTFREAVSSAAKRLGIGGRAAAPTAAQRARYNGVPGGEGGGGGRETVRVEDNRTNRTLAAKAFPNLDKNGAWKAFLKLQSEQEE